jgi:hypothetical protein
VNEAEVLAEVRGVVSGAVSSVLRSRPDLDREELEGEAVAVALHAIRSWRPGPASIKTYVYGRVRQHLASSSRWGAWRRRHSRQAHKPLPPEVPMKEGFSVSRLLLELSEKAALVVRIVLEEGWGKTVLAKTLKDELGWERAEIVRVFKEIREAL